MPGAGCRQARDASCVLPWRWPVPPGTAARDLLRTACNQPNARGQVICALQSPQIPVKAGLALLLQERCTSCRLKLKQSLSVFALKSDISFFPPRHLLSTSSGVSRAQTHTGSAQDPAQGQTVCGCPPPMAQPSPGTHRHGQQSWQGQRAGKPACFPLGGLIKLSLQRNFFIFVLSPFSKGENIPLGKRPAAVWMILAFPGYGDGAGSRSLLSCCCQPASPSAQQPCLHLQPSTAESLN